MTGLDQQKGFTLVEVLTVMLVLVAVASVTVQTASTLAFQGRDEVTKDRYAKIKAAILGNPNIVVNGQPDISGFVADMGRLPRNIHELLVQEYCDNDYSISSNTPDSDRPITYADNQAWCTGKTPTGNWIQQTDWNPPIATTLGYGWRGPYISVKKADYEGNALSDGWGNIALEDTVVSRQNQNYGWGFCLGDDVDIATNPYTCNQNIVLDEQLIIKSLGKEGSEDFQSAPTETYARDYPENISKNIDTDVAIEGATVDFIENKDWTVSINNIGLFVLTTSNGNCNGATCSDPAFTTPAACQPIWDTATSTCSDAVYTTQTTCQPIWDTATSTCNNAPYTSQETCKAPHAHGSWTNHNAKSNCEASGNQWTSRTQNICLKITYRSIDGGGQTVTTLLLSSTVAIPEDGREKEINFTFPAQSKIPTGDVFVGVYNLDQPAGTACTNTDDATYPATCKNTNSHANFTPTNCETNGGRWRAGANVSEHTCINMLTGVSGIRCTGTASTELGGTWDNKPLIQLSLTPNTTLPTINW